MTTAEDDEPWCNGSSASSDHSDTDDEDSEVDDVPSAPFMGRKFPSRAVDETRTTTPLEERI